MPRRDVSLAQIAYQELLQQIVTLEIRPGALLQERALAGALHMSRTPVREALNRLEQESWVKINARRNIAVKGLDTQDVRELFAARSVMELRGIDVIFDNRLTREVAATLKNALLRMQQSSLSDYEFNRADIEFHEVIALADNNRHFAELWKRIMLENARMGLIAFEVFEKDSRKICSEHLHILEGFEKNSRKAAKHALSVHLGEVMHAILLSVTPQEESASTEDVIFHAVHSARVKRLAG